MYLVDCDSLRIIFNSKDNCLASKLIEFSSNDGLRAERMCTVRILVNPFVLPNDCHGNLANHWTQAHSSTIPASF